MAKHGNRNAHDGRYPPVHDPSAARGALGRAILRALAADFPRNAGTLVKALRERRPFDYLKLVVALLPKEYRVKEVELLETIPDDELAKIITELRKVIALREQEEREAAPAPAQPAQGEGEAGAQERGGARGEMPVPTSAA